MDQLKTQVAALKQNDKALKESNLKIHDLTKELDTVRADFETLKSKHEEKLKLKSQQEKDLKDKNNKADSELELLKAQLAEALENSMHLKTQNDELKAQLNDIETERANHQKLIKEFGKLEQRFEKVQGELLKHNKSASQIGQPGSMTTSISSLKQDGTELESLMEEIDIKSGANVQHNVDKNKLANGSDTDLGLMGKLQKRINQLETERKDLLRSGCVAVAPTGRNDHDNNNNNKDYVSEKIER